MKVAVALILFAVLIAVVSAGYRRLYGGYGHGGYGGGYSIGYARPVHSIGYGGYGHGGYGRGIGYGGHYYG